MIGIIIDMHNCITANELEKIVRHQLKLIFDQPEMAESLPPLMIWGAPGLGKSTIIRTVAENRHRVEKIRLKGSADHE